MADRKQLSPDQLAFTIGLLSQPTGRGTFQDIGGGFRQFVPPGVSESLLAPLQRGIGTTLQQRLSTQLRDKEESERLQRTLASEERLEERGIRREERLTARGQEAAQFQAQLGRESSLFQAQLAREGRQETRGLRQEEFLQREAAGIRAEERGALRQVAGEERRLRFETKQKVIAFGGDPGMPFDAQQAFLAERSAGLIEEENIARNLGRLTAEQNLETARVTTEIAQRKLELSRQQSGSVNIKTATSGGRMVFINPDTQQVVGSVTINQSDRFVNDALLLFNTAKAQDIAKATKWAIDKGLMADPEDFDEGKPIDSITYTKWVREVKEKVQQQQQLGGGELGPAVSDELAPFIRRGPAVDFEINKEALLGNLQRGTFSPTSKLTTPAEKQALQAMLDQEDFDPKIVIEIFTKFMARNTPPGEPKPNRNQILRLLISTGLIRRSKSGQAPPTPTVAPSSAIDAFEGIEAAP